MTRKHFKAIAEALFDAKPVLTDYRDNSIDIGELSKYNVKMEQWRCDVLEIDKVLARTNILYNSSRFLSACGFES